MPSEAKLTLVRIASMAEALAWSGLTYPAYGPLLLAAAGGQAGLAVGAAAAEKPVGLVLADLRGTAAEIVSLYVTVEHRKRGIGRRLLEAMEQELHAAGCREATLVFAAGERTIAAAERLLAARCWSPPVPRMHLLTLGTGSLAKVAAAPWFRPLALPAGASIFPWTELSALERQALVDAQRRHPWFPEFLSPFREPELMDARTSLGLRRGGDVAGWMVTHRLDPQTLRYTSLFVRPDVPWPLVGWQLLVEAIRRQRAQAGPQERATLGVRAGSRFWRVVEKRLLPFVELDSMVTTMESRKDLEGSAGS